MNMIVFLLLMGICIGLIYIIHKYLNKHEFYILAITYTIISFILSFKIVDIFGININLGVIFSSGLLMLLYYFINRYDRKESIRLIFIIGGVLLLLEMFLLLNALIIPSVGDVYDTIYYNMIVNNYLVFIFGYMSMIGELVFSNYLYDMLRKEEKNKLLKTIIISSGILFLSTFIMSFVNYILLYNYKTSLFLALDNYLIKVVIVILFIIIMHFIFKIKKVK